MVWKSSSWTESTQEKKHISICFHEIPEAVISQIIHIVFVKGKNNLSVCLLKLVSETNKRSFCTQFMYLSGGYVKKYQGLSHCGLVKLPMASLFEGSASIKSSLGS